MDRNGKLVGMIVKADIYRFLITLGHIESVLVEWVISKDAHALTSVRRRSAYRCQTAEKNNNIIGCPCWKEISYRSVISIEDILGFLHRINRAGN